MPDKPITMWMPADRRPERLTLAEVEAWCAQMRSTGASDDAPVYGQVAVGGGLRMIEGWATVPEQGGRS
jgi:hypothetical protein